MRLVGGYAFQRARLMLLYQRTDVGALDEDGFGASIAWTFGDNTAKLQYLAANIWQTVSQVDPLDNPLESLLSVGLDHKLGKATKLFVFYTTGDIGETSASTLRRHRDRAQLLTPRPLRCIARSDQGSRVAWLREVRGERVNHRFGNAPRDHGHRQS